MNQSPHLIIFLTGAMLIQTAACSSEIYKWVDSTGRVHYGQERPALVQNVKAIEVHGPYTPPSPTHREDLDRIQNFTQQLAAERLALEQQRYEERTLAPEREYQWQQQNRRYRGKTYVIEGGYSYDPPYYYDRSYYYDSGSYRHGGRYKHRHSRGKSYGYLRKSFRSGDVKAAFELGYGSSHGYHSDYRSSTKYGNSRYGHRRSRTYGNLRHDHRRSHAYHVKSHYRNRLHHNKHSRRYTRRVEHRRGAVSRGPSLSANSIGRSRLGRTVSRGPSLSARSIGRSRAGRAMRSRR